MRRALSSLHEFNILRPTTEKADARRGQEYWLQSNENEIRWDLLEDRQASKLERERGRTEKARSVVGQHTEEIEPVVPQQSKDAVGQQAKESVPQQAKVLSDNNTKPTETHRNPEREKPAPDFKNMTVSQARQVPTLRMYARATEFFPGSILWEYVDGFIREHKLTEKQIRDAAIAWAGKGYKPSNVQGILEWARDGIPANGNTSKPAAGPAIDEQAVEATRKMLEEKYDGKPFAPPPPGLRPQLAVKQLAQQKGLRK